MCIRDSTQTDTHTHTHSSETDSDTGGRSEERGDRQRVHSLCAPPPFSCSMSGQTAAFATGSVFSG
eukprot:568022-Rhodomonas_salina.1